MDMKLIPSKTRIIEPPRTNLYEVLDESIKDLRETDVVAVTSKIVAISEGRYIRMEDIDKDTLVEREAEYIKVQKGRKPLTVVHHALISGAGIDESNGFGHYVLLPEDPFRSAEEIHEYLTKKFGLEKLGIIITDSHSLPFRYGAMSISIGCFGFLPVESHIGRKDLFGRVMKYSTLNVADSLAAACALVSGECDERTPIVIVRDVPNLMFTKDSPREKLFIPHEEDLYRSLFKDFRQVKKSYRSKVIQE